MFRPAAQRIRGDFQTPRELAVAVCALLRRDGRAPAAVVEPTCGDGAFLVAAAAAFPRARLLGVDIDPTHAGRAAGALGERARIEVADAYAADWEARLAALPEPLLVLGNPPWVTTAGLTRLGAGGPARDRIAGLRGLDAITGRGNFDVAEWLIRRLLAAAAGRDFTLAMLCKQQVARRVIAALAGSPTAGAVYRIDASAAFGARVAAALLVVRSGPPATSWPEYDHLDAATPVRRLAVTGGELVADAEAAARTAHLGADAGAVSGWRSGIKHDCATVLELDRRDGGLRNRGGEPVDVEDDLVFPLLKGGDLAAGRLDAPRALLVPQRRLDDDPARLRREAPRAWAYLERHRGAFAARRSRIYRDRPAFALFGVGDYSFAPWKVAVSGLHKRLAFALVGPRDGRPVVVDDTCYFLPFGDRATAAAAHTALCSPAAREFLDARIFWDAKRPIRKAVLDRLDLARLARSADPVL